MTQVPPRGLFPAKYRRPQPHIYSDSEIADLMAAASHIRSALGLRGATLKTLIGLLAATGLRPGEALKLDLGDVDLVDGVLAIRESKLRRSRVVPLEQSASAALSAYAGLRDAVLPRRETPAFLVTERGSRLEGGVARRTFANLCQEVGLRPRRHRRAGRGPRLQDLRHNADTRIMLSCGTGVGVQRGLDAVLRSRRSA